jgi:tetratricopeptide (TPR) repeat protein
MKLRAVFLITTLVACIVTAGCRSNPVQKASSEKESRDFECATLLYRSTILAKQADVLRENGQIREAILRYERAMSYLERIKELQPDWNTGAVFQLVSKCKRATAELNKQIGLTDQRAAEAIARFEIQHTDNSYSAGPFIELGDFYFDEGEYDDSLTQYQEALIREPGNVTAQMNMGRLYSRIGNFDKAIEIYKALIETNPNLAIAHYNLAGVYFRNEKPTYAIREYKSALELDPFNPEIHNALGLVYKQLRQYDQAIIHFKNAININPYHPAANYNLGITFMAKNNYPTALNYLKRAREIFGKESPMGKAISSGIKRMHRYR